MQLITRDSPGAGQLVALIVVENAVALAVFAFLCGRSDPSTKTAVLLATTGLINNLMGLGAGILVGGPSRTHQVETPNASRVVSSESQTTTIQPSNGQESGL